MSEKVMCPGYVPKVRPALVSKDSIKETATTLVRSLLPSDSGTCLTREEIIRQIQSTDGLERLSNGDCHEILDALVAEWWPNGQPEEFTT